MARGSIDSIESLGLYDGPGIRVVVFLNGCKLRCQYCHNPEMWSIKHNNISCFELVRKVERFKNYIKDNGGITFSGGEPLLQPDFLIACCKKLKKKGFHIALDTAGVGVGRYEEILQYVDLIIFDVKYADSAGYTKLTGGDIAESEKFLEVANKLNKPFWVRQVIIPTINDNEEYLLKLKEYMKKINNIEKVEFLPFHKLGLEKYKALNIDFPLSSLEEMDKVECEKLYNKFMKL